MTLQKIRIKNFQGLVGEHEFELDKITALCQGVGAGKTSLLNAIRYGLTGVKPDGEIVSKGKEFAAVQLEFDSGKKYIRMDYAEKGKSAKCFLNRSSITQKNLNQEISREFGQTPNKTAKIISSQELLEGLNTQQFGELLLQYLPEQMTVETILKRYPEATKEEVKIIKENLPEGEFTSEKLDEFYKLVTDRRRYAKKKVAEQEAVVNQYGNLADPEVTQAELMIKNEKLMNLRDKDLIYQNALKNYNTTLAAKNDIDKKIEVLDKQIEQIKASDNVENDISMLNQSIENNKQTITSSIEAIKRLESYSDMVQKAIALINDPNSSEMTKEDVINGLKENLEKTEEDKNNFIKAHEKALEDDTKYQEELRNANKELIDFRRKKSLLEQRENLEKRAPQVPEKPVPVEGIEDLPKQMEEYNNLCEHVRIYQDLKNKEKYLAENQKKLADYESLAESFSPRGKVKEAITSYYLDEFAKKCNEKANKIFKGMNLKFVSEKGVNVLVDMDGNGNYLDLESLSRGERATTIFLLLDMLSELSGFNMLFLDEMSILDAKTFEALLSVIINNKDEFDLCVISAIDHKDTMSSLKKKKINVLEIDRKNEKKKEVEKEEEIEEEIKNEDVINNVPYDLNDNNSDDEIEEINENDLIQLDNDIL